MNYAFIDDITAFRAFRAWVRNYIYKKWDAITHASLNFTGGFAKHRKISKPHGLSLELSDRSAIWQAHRQHYCRSACQISKQWDNSNYQSRGFETLRDLTIGLLNWYQNGDLFAVRARRSITFITEQLMWLLAHVPSSVYLYQGKEPGVMVN